MIPSTPLRHEGGARRGINNVVQALEAEPGWGGGDASREGLLGEVHTTLAGDTSSSRDNGGIRHCMMWRRNNMK